MTEFAPLHGHCACKTITYTLTAAPLVTHCCHCTFCQRESGSAFAINIMLEAYNLTTSTSPTLKGLPSLSSPAGEKHLVAQCPRCLTALYAYYGGNKSMVFVKAGTLDDESRKRVRPDVHIFTSTQVGWVDLKSEAEKGVKICEEYYEKEDVWSKESLKRREVLLEWVEEQKKGKEAGVAGSA